MIDLEKIADALDSVDDYAQDIVTAMLAWVERVTDRHFHEPRQFVLRYSGGVPELWLPEQPVEHGDDPLVLAESWESDAWSEVDDGDYELLTWAQPPYEAVLRHDTEWPDGTRNIRVTFWAGYEFGALPPDIERLVLEMAAARWLDRGRENLKSETIGGYSYTRFDGGGGSLRADWQQTIDSWRRRVMA